LIALAVHGVDLDGLRARGWVRLAVAEPLMPYASGGFATPDGRANLWSAEQVSGVPGADHPPAAPARAVDGGSSLPLVLLTPKTQTRFLNSSYSALHATMEAPPAVEMHAADAAARQVGDGDVVRVWNERGSLELPVRVSGRAQEGTVVVPWGWWGEGVNVNALTNDTLTDWGGGVAFFDTRVDVSRVR
jgi:anaerobic selenocysteine-containing dehydrogenase